LAENLQQSHRPTTANSNKMSQSYLKFHIFTNRFSEPSSAVIFRVFPEGAGVSVSLPAALDFARVRFLQNITIVLIKIIIRLVQNSQIWGCQKSFFSAQIVNFRAERVDKRRN